MKREADIERKRRMYREWAARRRAERKKLGLCLQCDRPAKGRARCSAHRAVVNRHKRASVERCYSNGQRVDGVPRCSLCGQDARNNRCRVSVTIGTHGRPLLVWHRRCAVDDIALRAYLQGGDEQAFLAAVMARGNGRVVAYPAFWRMQERRAKAAA